MSKRIINLILAICLCVTCLFSGCAKYSDGIDIYHNGKGEAQISINSDKSPEEFEAAKDDLVKGIKLISGYVDIINVKQVTKTDTGYDINIKFRRIDKVKLNGSIERKKISQYVREGSQEKALLQKLAIGSIGCTMQAYYNERMGQVIVGKKTKYKVEPRDREGNVLATDKFFQEAERLNNRNKIIMWRMFDISNIDSVKVRLPGSIKFVGGKDVEILSDNEILLKPCVIKATLLKSVIETDADGNEIMTPVPEEKMADSFIGYVVYESSLSNFEIALIVIASMVFVAIVTAIICYFYITGKREIEREEKELNEKSDRNDDIG